MRVPTEHAQYLLGNREGGERRVDMGEGGGSREEGRERREEGVKKLVVARPGLQENRG